MSLEPDDFRRGKSRKGRALVVGLLAALSLVASLAAYQQLEIATLKVSVPNVQQENSTSNPPFSEVPIPTQGYTVTTNAALGLSLQLYASSSIYPGQFIQLTMTVSNILSTPNNLTVAGEGASPFTGCWTFPGQLYVIPGLYTSEDVSRGIADAVNLDYPGMYSCPVALHIALYTFAPNSDNVTLSQSCSTDASGCYPWSEATASYTLEVNGYWTGSAVSSNPNAVFHVFPQGVYTIYAVDPWNQTLFDYFEVSTSTG